MAERGNKGEKEVSPGRRALRRGITTGACAAAAAKAATKALLSGFAGKGAHTTVPVALPGGASIAVRVESVRLSGGSAVATVIKDAGDDPDVTNGAEIVAEAAIIRKDAKRAAVTVRGGEGVGVVTRPGLKVPVGKPAINPVPMRMIRSSVLEAVKSSGVRASIAVTISVPGGELLAKKTMNPRLGIIGGISILGTTGIVEPLSLSAYTHSISCGVDVVLATGLGEVVFSTGRTSEKAVEGYLRLPPHAFVLTGDHMGFALRDASRRRGLKRVTVAGQFGKFTKLASNRFETHCSDSEVDLEFLARVARDSGATAEAVNKIRTSNTAREAFFILKDAGLTGVFDRITALVRKNSRKIAGPTKEVYAILVGYDGEIVSISGKA